MHNVKSQPPISQGQVMYRNTHDDLCQNTHDINPLELYKRKKKATMKFYHEQHKYYCGIDLHARKM
ncbi:MAG: hypothetical protein SVR08_18485 [Spirochaetota bacterium]|nr:hypothetical protein [Spirochaetota bacterium]